MNKKIAVVSIGYLDDMKDKVYVRDILIESDEENN